MIVLVAQCQVRDIATQIFTHFGLRIGAFAYEMPAHFIVSRHDAETGLASQRRNTLLSEAGDAGGTAHTVEARNEEGSAAQRERRMHAQAEKFRERHVRSLLPQDLCETLVRAASELHDVVFRRSLVGQGVIEIEEAVVGSSQQQLGPFALYTGRAGDKEPMRRKIFAERIAAGGNLVIREALQWPSPLGQPLRRLLHAKVAD
ncbi:hypothetical protein WI42_32775 [Burkholderia ubonensis]|nr:hypothetical protein WI42_32775 [Burkholderia ubonensis]KVA32388.1 hypothetical protein WI43_29825 [Burkholderia ubonensis]KVA48628.1 hypothetical protein WI46_02730 [Burkholderia ubonensis]